MVGGNDDTVAGSEPAMTATHEHPQLVAGRYQIVRWLGGGGMGRVYEARDTELDERVALKMLRSGLTESALERFRREVRLTRKIQHPNVARMHDIGDHAGEKFLTMELVEGHSLAREISRAMEWPVLLGVAKQICAGLAAAHDKGVVHRDLKPDNVLLERDTGRVVITDFGIARSTDDATVTGVGAVVGTPRYMSPEQLGGGAVDHRSDLFSLGVILYELATGTRPWQGDNAITIAVAQATQPARPMTETSRPTGFAALVARCLHLDPEARFASARDVADALDALGGAPTPPRDAIPTTVTRPSGPLPRTPPTTTTPLAPTTLAVLPFACPAGDEYLADGVLEDLVDTLSASTGLRVRPAGRTRKSEAKDPREVGRDVGVDHVVTGTLRRVPTGIRLAARLVGVVDGFQIWAHRAEGSEAEVLALSDELARGIATALSTRASATERPTDPRAVDLYLRARAELRLVWGTHVSTAADLLDRAYELSPTSTPIAGARAFAATQAWMMTAEGRLKDRALEAVERGLATGHAEAFLGSAALKLNLGDPIGGAADLGTALVRAPMLGQAQELSGKILVELGALAEARMHFETARGLDPTRGHIITADLARLDALEGQWDRAMHSLATVVADPDRSISQLGAVSQARLALWRGDREGTERAAKVFGQTTGNNANRIIEFISNAASTELSDPEIRSQFTATFGGPDKPLRAHLMGLQLLAEVAMLLGREAIAFETLEHADTLGLLDIVVLDRCPLFDRVRELPRVRALRDSVRQRANRVLAAFRSTAG